MSKRLKGSWIRTGVVAVALLGAILLQMKTLTHILGVMLGGMLWFAVANYLPKRISDYSKAQKILVGAIFGTIVIVTALFVNTIM